MTEILALKETEFLFEVLSYIAPLSLGLRQDFARFVRTENHPKKHKLLVAGQTARKIYFIKKGFARGYYLDAEGNEHTLWFMGTGDLMISVFSFFTQQPAYEYIELLEDSEVQSMTYTDVQTVYHEHPAFNLHGRKLTELYYIRAEERQIMMHQKLAADRVKLLRKTHPNIFQQASLGQIASCLNITLETLSRLRASGDI